MHRFLVSIYLDSRVSEELHCWQIKVQKINLGQEFTESVVAISDSDVCGKWHYPSVKRFIGDDVASSYQACRNSRQLWTFSHSQMTIMRLHETWHQWFPNIFSYSVLLTRWGSSSKLQILCGLCPERIRSTDIGFGGHVLPENRIVSGWPLSVSS